MTDSEAMKSGESRVAGAAVRPESSDSNSGNGGVATKPQSSTPPLTLDSIAIQKIIPHRYPFLMVDRVIEFVDNHRLVALKNVTVNEPFFNGHFPGIPVMPGVLVIEAMAQAGAILALRSSEGVPDGFSMYLVGIEEMKFKRQVVPGDTLRIEMEHTKRRRPIWWIKGSVTVDGKIVASGVISAAEVADRS